MLQICGGVLEIKMMSSIKFTQKLLSAILISASTFGALAIPQTSAASIYVQVAPPAPRYERFPEPRRGFVWVPGYWDWRGHRHIWIGGVWLKARHGYQYQPHRWVQHDRGWQLNRGRWDRDGDGVPNRYDRAPDNPYRR